MKTKLLILFTLGLILVILPLVANAEIIDSGECGPDVTWTLDDAKTLTISGNGYMTSAPWKKHNDVKKIIVNDGVKNIYNEAFICFRELTEVSLPTSLTVIGSNSFNACSALTEITIPNGVTSIEGGAFIECTKLKKITLPGTLGSIGAWTFEGCRSLESITIPDSVLSIGENSFQSCTALKSFVFPRNITKVEDQMFLGCENLLTVTIPDRVTSIGHSCFWNCSSLQGIDMPDSVTNLGTCMFWNCLSMTHARLSENIEHLLPNDTFNGCRSLESITLPQKINYINSNAFLGCTQLKSVTIENNGNAQIGENAFKNCISLASITISCGNNQSKEWFQENGYADILKIKPHELEKHDRVEPTTTSGGTEEYWECTSCKILFSDSEGKNRIDEPVVIPPLGNVDISKAKISKIADQVYTGKTIKPDLTVTYDGIILTEGTDYSIKWKNNKNPGKATVTLTGKEPNTGTKTATFKILPKPTELSSLKAGKKSLTAKWKKGSKIDGYEIQYSLKSNFKSAKKIEISGASTKKTEIDGLKKKKTYYVRIRTYKEVDGKKYYSEWSDAMEKKTK